MEDLPLEKQLWESLTSSSLWDRVRTMRNELETKNEELLACQKTLLRLKKDFTYNLKLIDDRDVELESYDNSFKKLNEELQGKDTLIADLRLQLMSMSRDKQKLIEANQDSSKLKTMVDDIEKQKVALAHKCAEDRKAAEIASQELRNTAAKLECALLQERADLENVREQLESRCTELAVSRRSNEVQSDALSTSRSKVSAMEHEMLTLQQQEQALQLKCKESEAQLADAHKIHLHIKQQQQTDRIAFDASSAALTSEFEDKMVRLLNALKVAENQSTESQQQLQAHKSAHKEALEKLLERQRIRNEEHKSILEAKDSAIAQLTEETISQRRSAESQLHKEAGEAAVRLSALADKLNREHHLAVQKFEQRLASLQNESELQAASHAVVLDSAKETHAREMAHAQRMHQVLLQTVEATGRAEAKEQLQQQEQQKLIANAFKKQLCSWQESSAQQKKEVNELRCQLGAANAKLQRAVTAQQLQIFNQELKQRVPEQRCELLQEEVAELNRNLTETTRSLASATTTETQLRSELTATRAAMAECEEAQAALSSRMRHEVGEYMQRAREQEGKCKSLATKLAALKGNRSVPISGESIGVKENEQTHAEMEEEMENPRADESDEPESASSVDTSRTVADVVAVATAALEAAASASSEDDDKNCFEGDMGNVSLPQSLGPLFDADMSLTLNSAKRRTNDSRDSPRHNVEATSRSASSCNSESATTQQITVQDTASKERRALAARNEELVAENSRLQQQCDTLSEENLRLKEAVARMREEMVHISEVHRTFSTSSCYRRSIHGPSSAVSPATPAGALRSSAMKAQALQVHQAQQNSATRLQSSLQSGQLMCVLRCVPVHTEIKLLCAAQISKTVDATEMHRQCQMLMHKLRASNSANMQLVMENKKLMESSKVLRSKLNKLVRSSHNFGQILSFARRGWEAPMEGRYESSHAAPEWILPPPLPHPSSHPDAHRRPVTTRNPWVDTAHSADVDSNAPLRSRQSVESVDAADQVAPTSDVSDSRGLPGQVDRRGRSRHGRHDANTQPSRQRNSVGVSLSARRRGAMLRPSHTAISTQHSPKNSLSRPQSKTGMSDRTTDSQRAVFRQLKRMQKKREDQKTKADVRVPVNYNLLRAQR